MKFIFLAISLLFGIQLSTQDSGIPSKIDVLNSKIQQSQKGERLAWLDSLTKLTYRNPKLKYDATLRQTIDLAIALDSLSFAALKVADLMGFNNNYIGKPEEGLKLFNTYIEKLKKGADFSSIGNMYLNMADSYYYTGNIDKSFEYYALTKTYALKAKDKHLYGAATMYTGYNQSEIGKFSEASQSLKEAAVIFTKLKDTTNILGAKTELAILYSRNGFYEEAKKERNECIALIGNTNRYRTLSNQYFNAARGNETTGDYKKQLINIKASFVANNKTNNTFLVEPEILMGLISAYCNNDSISKAETYFEDLKALYEKNKTPQLREQYVRSKGILSLAKDEHKNALKYNKELLLILQNKTHTKVKFLRPNNLLQTHIWPLGIA
jgi:tetratricopeptide (TPR) repeat protein